MEAERARRVLRQFLETDLLLGVAETPLRRSEAVLPAATATSEPTARPGPARPAPAATPPTPPPAAAPSGHAPDLGEGTARERFARLPAALAADPTLAGRLGGQPPALGAGALPARVVFVGEAPGPDGDAEEAQKLLDGMVKAMKLSDAEVFRCPCLPFEPASGGHPSPADLAAGAGALKAQLLLAAPELVVAMGGAAAKALLGTTVGITRLRGTWASCAWTDPPVPVMPTLSPAFVLRSYTKHNRTMVWEDLQEVMKRLGEA